MFTGDRSGDFLYAALWRAGLANQPTSHHRGDGLRLDGVWISAAVRCVPPDNRPSTAERDRCLPFATRELELLADVRVILCLGAFAWEAALALVAPELRPRPRFAHGAELAAGSARQMLLASYHVSQQNTFTGRLTPEMLDDVIARAANAAGAPRSMIVRVVADGDFAWAGTPSEPAAQPPPARQRSRVAPLLAAVAIAAVVTVALVMASGGRDHAPRHRPVALAAAVTTGRAGFHFDMTISASLAGKAIGIDGSGSMSERQPLSGTMTLSVAGTTINEIVVAPLHLRPGAGIFEQLVPRGVQEPLNRREPGADARDAPRSGECHACGCRQARGSSNDALPRGDRPDPRRRGRGPRRDALARGGVRQRAQRPDRIVEPTDDVWIDGQNRVRRILLGINACTRDGNLSESAQIDYSDFGPQPSVSAPPPTR